VEILLCWGSTQEIVTDSGSNVDKNTNCSAPKNNKKIKLRRSLIN